MENIPYWSMQADPLLGELLASANGLSQNSVREILGQTGPNQIGFRAQTIPLGLFLNQFKSPVVLILIFATIVSAFLRDWDDAVIILLIVLCSAELKRPWNWISGLLLFIMFTVVLFLPAGRGESAEVKLSANFAHLLGWHFSFLFTKS